MDGHIDHGDRIFLPTCGGQEDLVPSKIINVNSKLKKKNYLEIQQAQSFMKAKKIINLMSTLNWKANIMWEIQEAQYFI